MTINEISGPTGSQYIPDYRTSPTEQQMLTDITTLTTDWSTKQTTLNQAIADCNSAKTNVDNQVTIVLNLVASGASQADIDAATTLLTTYRNTYNTKEAAYNAAVTAFDTTATLLVNAKATYQETLDDDTNTALNNYITQIQGTIDSTLYDKIVAANNNRQAMRAALDAAVNNYRNLEDSIKAARETLIGAQYDSSLAQANAILNNLTQKSQWATLVSNAAAPYNTLIATTTTNLSGFISSRSGLETALTNAADNLQASYDNPDVVGQQAGLSTLFEEAATSLASVTPYIAQMNAARAAADSYVNNLIAAEQAADAAALAAYEASIGSIPNPDAALAAAHAAANISIASLLGSDFLKTLGINISFPTLPAAGQDISMLDLMGFITSTQLLLQQLKQHTKLSDNQIYQLRMQIWDYILSLVAEEYGARMAYLMEQTISDQTYENQVKQDNANTYQTAVTQETTINGEINNINAVIDQVNAANSANTANYDTVINALNEASQGSVNLINQSNEVQPDSVNLLDLYGLDPTMAYPALLPTPSAESPFIIPHITALPAPPDYSATPPPAQADIDAYNNAVRAIDDTLYPISGELAAAAPPITFTLLDPIVYRQDIDIHQFGQEFNFAALQSSVNALVNVVVRAGLEDVSTLQVDFTALQRALHHARPVSGTGTGVGFQTASVAASPTLIGRMALELMDGENFKNTVKDLLEQGVFIGCLPVALRQPPGLKNYSVMGIIRGERLTDIDLAALKNTQQTIEQRELQVVADQLLSQANNTSLLRQLATSILAKDPRSANLTATQANAVITSLTVMLQETLIATATLALIASPGTSTLEQERNLKSLLGTPSFDTIVTDIQSQGITVSASLTPGSPAYYEELFNKAENITPADQRENFREQVAAAMAQFGILPGALTPGVPLGTAVRQAMEGAPSAFVASLGINLGALPPDALQKAQGIVTDTLSGITFLSEDEKLKLAVAIGGGIIAAKNVPILGKILADLQAGKSSPQLLAQLDDLNPREIPKQLRERIKDIAKGHEKEIEAMVQAFMTEQNPAKFVVDFLLAPMHFLEKQFSLRTATPVKGIPPTTAMPV